MAAFLPGDISQDVTHGFLRHPGTSELGPGWYSTRKEIEEKSPSKRDGIDWKKETYVRNSYCSFLQDLGMTLKVPQVTITTAIIYCHRFFLRHSLGKNDWRVIATACMFLAGKVEETPRLLEDVILVSYGILNNNDPFTAQRIQQKEVYEQHKELILFGERIVIQTLGFDLHVDHPYEPLIEAIKKLKVAQNNLAQVAWNFVNDGLRTSLYLQFKPHHIAAGAIFLAAKFLKVKLPSDGEEAWWQEFDVTHQQLEEVSNELLELYEENRVPPLNDVEGATRSGAASRAAAKVPASNDEKATTNSNSHTGAATSYIKKIDMDKIKAAREKRRRESGHIIKKTKVMDDDDLTERELEDGIELAFQSENNIQDQRQNWSKPSNGSDNRNVLHGRHRDHKDKHHHRCESDLSSSEGGEISSLNGIGPKSGNRKRKASSSPYRNNHFRSKLAFHSEKNMQDQRQNWYKSSYISRGRHRDHTNKQHHEIKSLSSCEPDLSTLEEGAISTLDDIGLGPQSPKSGSRKRKAHRSKFRWVGNSETRNRRHLQEIHV